jgi:hypothetical protein
MGLFDVRVWLYPGADPDGDPSLWGAEEDISAYVRHPGNDGGAPITYSAGKGDEAPSVDASQMTLTLDNRDGRFSTDNILGPYYGDLDTNTPIQMGVVSFSDSFTRTESNGWGTVDSTRGWAWTHTGPAGNWSTDGDVGEMFIASANTAHVAMAGGADATDADVQFVVIPAAVATGASFSVGAILRRTDSNNYLVANLQFLTGGTLRLDLTRWDDNVASTIASVNPVPSASYSAAERWVIRAQVDGTRIRAKVWEEASAEPAAWTITGTDTTQAGTVAGIYFARFSGNTNSGVNPIAAIDDYRVIALEFTGSVVSWPLRWDKSGNNSWAPITAAGVLRRINQGTYPILSPLRRQLGGTATMVGYWPLEDGSLATSFSSALRSQLPASYSLATPASDNTLPGGGPTPTLSSASGTISARTTKGQGGTGFSVLFFFKLPSLPGSKTRIARIRCSSGPCRIYDLSIDAAGVRYSEGLSADGTVVTSDFGVSPVDYTEWTAWQLEIDNSVGGGVSTWVSLVYQVGATTTWFQTDDITGTNLTTVSSIGLTGPSGTAFAHVWFGQNTLPFVDNNFFLVSSGYDGESAADRFERVCGEAGIPCVVRPVTNSELMGPQRESTTPAVIESCVKADYGVVAERSNGLEFIGREARWNATTQMAVSVAAGQIGEAPEPVRDDQRLRNRWTVSRTDGGSAVFEDEDSIARSGTWEDSDTINTFQDGVLENHAAFRVMIGTQNRLRWPSIRLNFARNPTLLPDWRGRGYGWRLTVETDLEQVQGHEPDLIVEGYVATLWPDGWTADLNCSSASIWKAAVADDTGILGRADIEECTVSSLITSTATSIPITTATGFLKWDNTAGLWSGGVDLYVGGERVTITGITNGAGQAQTLTGVTRGVNGYAFAHPSGTEVRLWDPAIVAL